MPWPRHVPGRPIAPRIAARSARPRRSRSRERRCRRTRDNAGSRKARRSCPGLLRTALQSESRRPTVLVTDESDRPVPAREMNLSCAATGAVAALPAGTVLREQVFRLSVRGGEPEEAACRTCASPIPALPAVRCWLCGSWFGVPVLIELLPAAGTAFLFARFRPPAERAAFADLRVDGLALPGIDLAVH